MTPAEILPHLEAWAALNKAIAVQFERLRELTGADCESQLLAPVYAMQNAYTAMVAEKIGDGSEWLFWYELEGHMGRTPMTAQTEPGGPHRRIRTLKQLAKVIGS